MKKIFCLLLALLFLTGCQFAPIEAPTVTPDAPTPSGTVTVIPTPTDAVTTAPSAATTSEMDTALADLPRFSGEAAVPVNGNKPFFTADDIKLAEEGTPFEFYAELDVLGRCGVTYANVCKETMPTEERGEIGMVKPSGWHTVNYHDLVDGNYLYNRCHLIGFQLAGENANVQNLITGTRYLNTQGMLPYENRVANYVDKTENHVLYRVTPIFYGDNLVADGVLMEAQSIEDEGEGVTFCVYCYNVQPGIIIDYATGESEVDETYVSPTETPMGEVSYVLNTRSQKFHRPDCSGAATIAEYNRKETDMSRDELIAEGYSPCGICNP